MISNPSVLFHKQTGEESDQRLLNPRFAESKEKEQDNDIETSYYAKCYWITQARCHGICCCKGKINKDNDDDEGHHGGNNQCRDEPHHLLNDIKSQIFILQPNVMTNQLYELTYSLYVLVVRKQSCLFFNL